MIERAEIVDRLWEKAEPMLFLPKEAFIKNLDGWEIGTVEIDGVPAFATITKGPAFHFESFGTGRNVTWKIIRDCLQPIIDRYGYATTHTPKEDARQHRFNLLLGFVVTGEDAYDTHYRIERIRGAKCQ